MTEKERQFLLTPAGVRIPSLSLSDFNISPKEISDFFADENGCIILNITQSNLTVFVLPNFAQGKVVSITRKIPDTCPYKTYNDLRTHWKNTWDYELPESDKGIFYYQIIFRGFKHAPYTYPNCCVRADTLKFKRIDNAEEIGHQFGTDFRSKIPRAFLKNTQSVLKNANPGTSDNSLIEEGAKENILNLGSQVPQSAVKKCSQDEKTLQSGQGRPNNDLRLSENNIHQFDLNNSKRGVYRGASSILLDNSNNLNLRRDVIKDKDFREALNMKSYLNAQCANCRKSTTHGSSEFFPGIGNSSISGSSNILKRVWNLCDEERRVRKLSLPKSIPATETSFSQSIKSKSDKSSAVNQTSQDNELFYDSPLKKRSFELGNRGGALDGQGPSGQILSENLRLQREKNGFGKKVEIISPYFEGLQKEVENNEKVPKPGTTLSSKLKCYRLSNSKNKLPTQRVSSLKSAEKDRFTLDCKTKDIAIYFKEIKQQVGRSKLPEMRTKPFPRKLTQTRLNFERREEIEELVEKKKQRLDKKGGTDY